jgi:DNA replication protein DnaC
MQLSDSEIKQKLIKNGFYERYLESDWKYDKRLDGADKFLKKEYWYSSVNDAQQRRGLFIHGALGIGKSSLLGLIGYSLTKCLIVDVYYSTVEALIDKYADGNYTVGNNTKTCSILCLDDLGWENIGQGEFRMSKLVDVIKYRYGRELPTFFASNLSIEDIGKISHVGYAQIADILRDKRWVADFLYGHNVKDSKRGKK